MAATNRRRRFTSTKRIIFTPLCYRNPPRFLRLKGCADPISLLHRNVSHRSLKHPPQLSIFAHSCWLVAEAHKKLSAKFPQIRIVKPQIQPGKLESPPTTRLPARKIDGRFTPAEPVQLNRGEFKRTRTANPAFTGNPNKWRILLGNNCKTSRNPIEQSILPVTPIVRRF
jgi:hypothetical protein